MYIEQYNTVKDWSKDHNYFVVVVQILVFNKNGNLFSLEVYNHMRIIHLISNTFLLNTQDIQCPNLALCQIKLDQPFPAIHLS